MAGEIEHETSVLCPSNSTLSPHPSGVRERLTERKKNILSSFYMTQKNSINSILLNRNLPSEAKQQYIHVPFLHLEWNTMKFKAEYSSTNIAL